MKKRSFPWKPSWQKTISEFQKYLLAKITLFRLDKSQKNENKESITVNSYPMYTCSSIRHRFDVEIPLGKFAEITSILKGESTWK